MVIAIYMLLDIVYIARVMPRKKMSNEKQIQSLYTQIEVYGMNESLKKILEHLRCVFPLQAEKISRERKDKNIPIPEMWELTVYLVEAIEAIYECDVLRAGLRRLTKENDKLRQMRLL